MRKSLIAASLALLLLGGGTLGARLLADGATPSSVRPDGTVNLDTWPTFVRARGKHGVHAGWVYKGDLYDPARGVNEPPVYAEPRLGSKVVGRMTSDGFVPNATLQR